MIGVFGNGSILLIDVITHQSKCIHQHIPKDIERQEGAHSLKEIIFTFFLIPRHEGLGK